MRILVMWTSFRRR